MSNVRKFDEMAVVVDWIDAFKNRHLDALLDLYEDTATIECCEGGVFQGRPAMEQYWEPNCPDQGRAHSKSTPCFRSGTACLWIIAGMMKSPCGPFFCLVKRERFE
jgi:hypothetical protein